MIGVKWSLRYYLFIVITQFSTFQRDHHPSIERFLLVRTYVQNIFLPFTDYITLSRIFIRNSVFGLTNETGLRETATFINALMMELSVRTKNTILCFSAIENHIHEHYLAASCHKSRKIDISDVCMTYWLSNPKTIICMYIYLFTFNKIYSMRTGTESESKYCIWLFYYTDKPRKKSFRFQQSRIDDPTKFWNFILLICAIAVKLPLSIVIAVKSKQLKLSITLIEKDRMINCSWRKRDIYSRMLKVHTDQMTSEVMWL